VQEAAGESVELVYVDQGRTGEDAASAAEQGNEFEVIKLPDAKRGFILLPRCWEIERSVGWAARFRRLARNFERLTETLAGLHYVAFRLGMPHQPLRCSCEVIHALALNGGRRATSTPTISTR
jgi:transposase